MAPPADKPLSEDEIAAIERWLDEMPAHYIGALFERGVEPFRVIRDLRRCREALRRLLAASSIAESDCAYSFTEQCDAHEQARTALGEP